MAWLSFDLGWHYGWALERRGGALTHGHVDLNKNHATAGLKLLAKRQWLTGTLTMLVNAGEQLERIFYEQITFVGDNSVKAPHAHGKQLGAIESWCALKKVREPTGIPWDEVKKHLTGHRSASQQTILAEIKKQYPDVEDHNEASAVAVMLTARHRFGGCR
jgi:hypothetical protein